MIEEKILTPILERYMSIPFDQAVKNRVIKDRIDTVGNMQIIIYSRDHEPPHFHVKSKDKSINAKFLIEDGAYISGEINSKDIKRIAAFYNDVKTKIVMKMIWDKRYQ